ncbi:MAG: NAD(P)/FAD-dependent oxidoreductase, partial [Pseudomonadota bacterium]
FGKTIWDFQNTQFVLADLKARGTAARLHLALGALPVAPQGRDDLWRHRMVVAGDLDALERAFNPVKYGQASERPALEICVPTAADPGLAPEGHHVVSITAQYAPFAPAHGWSDEARAAFETRILEVAETALPGLRAHIVGSRLLVPDDLQARYGAAGGHWHHGELALDQFLFTRPVAFGAHYAQPLSGLTLCSAGAHPGGHLSGHPGKHAAEVVLQMHREGRS